MVSCLSLLLVSSPHRPSSQALHDGMARDAARMSVITLSFSSSLRAQDDIPPVDVFSGGS